LTLLQWSFAQRRRTRLFYFFGGVGFWPRRVIVSLET
jgi:hypothetical protein